MLQGKVYGVYFSPTGGTRAYVTALAGLLSCEAEEIDLTAREERARDHVFGPEDLVILGAPVYAGRLPQLEGGIFERLRGDGTPAVMGSWLIVLISFPYRLGRFSCPAVAHTW